MNARWRRGLLCCLSVLLAVIGWPTPEAAAQKPRQNSLARRPRQTTARPRPTARPAPVAKPAAPPEATPPEEEAGWIWSPAHGKDQVPVTACYFRRVFNLEGGETGSIQITADDRYDLFVNGRQVASGADWKLLKTHDLKPLLAPGRNVIAVKAENQSGNSAGLVARVKIKVEAEEKTYSTDKRWKTSLKPADGWQQADFDDSAWIPAHSFGPFGDTPPWAHQVAGDGGGGGRFVLSNEFAIEQVLLAEDTGSLLAMTFNEFGEILASREGGPLLLIADEDNDGIVDTVTTYCSEVKNCQGILALNGEVFTVSDGPDGSALYRLSDDDDGTPETVTALIKFEGPMGEHGPHAPVLGPDGLIYIMLGNHTRAVMAAADSSPYHDPYEGDLVQPRYEDANGHAVGIKAPGGVVIRTNTEGEFVQTFAGGFRNAYDLAFNRDGELLTHDSDMEWDLGQPWYRPTRVQHITPGAEFGWRSGWANWPAYYLDNLPAVLETGRGSPTGVEVYNHHRYPARYHNALFACDWSQGRILAIKMKPSGGSYQAQAEIFLEGRPLNATDLAVGPDGWMYFCTGGRGTEGGIYRLVWNGKAPPQPKLNGAMQAIRQPQLNSAWARQRVATLQQAMGAEWGRQLAAVADNPSGAVNDRVRALDLMQLVGPFPSTRALIKFSREKPPEVRAKAAYLMGIHTDITAGARLVELLNDSDPRVRRSACEALARGGYAAPAEPLVRLLSDRDRYVAWAARRALESVPASKWEDIVLDATDKRAFIVGATALLQRDVPDATIDAILTRGSDLMKDYLKDDDFVDLLRLFQIALDKGKLVGKNVPELCRQFAEEYPATEPPGREQRINRELVRLLAHLQVSSVLEPFMKQIEGKAPIEEKLHVAYYARFIKEGWTTEQKLKLVEFYEQAHALPGGHSFVGYLDNVSRDFIATFNEQERNRVLADAVRLPNSALWALVALPQDPGEEVARQLIELDGKLEGIETPEARRLATGVVAVLGRSARPEAMAHLREAFEKSPERREDLAMGLSQSPGGENWAVLVRSLSVIEGVAAQEVLLQLTKVEETPDHPEPIRQAILSGVKLGEAGAPLAIKLLGHWTGETIGEPTDSWDKALAKWQTWFQETYPDEPAPTLPQAVAGKWEYQELVGFLTNTESKHGNAERGAELFVKAQCAKCHRFGGAGDSVGPDLSTVGQRFQRKEILESLIYPSQVISDQYASKTIRTVSGLTYTGMVAPAGPDNMVVLQPNGEKATIARDEIEETAPSKKSSMPEGLLNNLSLSEIADLFEYLTTPAKPSTLAQEPGLLK